MSSSKNLEKEYDLLSEKIHHLRMALAIETDAAVKFKLEKQIEEAEAERTRIEQQLEGAEKLSITCPYRGLFAFREQDAEFFFGREAYTEQLAEAVQNKPFVAVIGASGSGKSSVVYAGLIWNKTAILLVLLLGLSLPCPAYATRMPGTMDYALLILLVSFIAGIVVATIVTLILFLIFKQKYSRKNYLKWWVVIALTFPILAMLVFGIVLAT